jgi:2-C-methyl-D-erythritol 4-phosphate cytidylyltransferase
MGSNRPKQYLPLRGRAMLEWSLAPFFDAGWVDGIVLVLAKGDSDFAKLPVAGHPKIFTVTGGVARADSVLAGLQTVAERSASLESPVYVLIHDAARPCLTVEDMDTLREEASDEQGGLLGVPVTDTLKQEERESSIRTVDHGTLWRAQAPQLFRLDLLRSALEQALAGGKALADEAAAMELAGYKPQLVRGRESNIKVTYPEDLPLAEFWLSRQEYAR